jgi:hydroxyacylglutathione hydrolase
VVAADDTAGLPSAPEALQLEVGLLQNFCTILSCPETGEAALVDPAFEVDRLLRELARKGLRLTKVLITHTHDDHIDGVEAVVAATGAAVLIDARERDALPSGLPQVLTIADGQDLAIGSRGVRALATPGHTIGGTSYLGDGLVVTGDVLFVGGCGRTDFPGGDVDAMWRSLQRLAALPEETRIYPGHDYGSTPTSTIGRELAENRFLRCRSIDDFRALRARR